jgi:hypothetical protein
MKKQARDSRTYETKEDRLEALKHIIKNIFYSKIGK